MLYTLVIRYTGIFHVQFSVVREFITFWVNIRGPTIYVGTEPVNISAFTTQPPVVTTTLLPPTIAEAKPQKLVDRYHPIYGGCGKVNPLLYTIEIFFSLSIISFNLLNKQITTCPM